MCGERNNKIIRERERERVFVGMFETLLDSSFLFGH